MRPGTSSKLKAKPERHRLAGGGSGTWTKRGRSERTLRVASASASPPLVAPSSPASPAPCECSPGRGTPRGTEAHFAHEKALLWRETARPPGPELVRLVLGAPGSSCRRAARCSRPRPDASPRRRSRRLTDRAKLLRGDDGGRPPLNALTLVGAFSLDCTDAEGRLRDAPTPSPSDKPATTTVSLSRVRSNARAAPRNLVPGHVEEPPADRPDGQARGW
jgi:hypothetical protein